MIYFTSDAHYFHKKVISYCNRPFSSVEEMNEKLIENWNKTVRKNDIVYILGDFAFCGIDKMKEIVTKLNGEKRFVKGNHDPSLKKLLEVGFTQVYENEKVKLNNHHEVLMSHFPFYPSITQRIKNKLKGIGTDSRYLHKRIVDDGKSILLHGHVHTSWKTNGRMINVGVDVWDYKPVSEKQIYEIITKL